MSDKYYDRTVSTDVRNEVNMSADYLQILKSKQDLKFREIQAMDIIAESLRSIAISFSTMVAIVENDLKEEQAFRLVNERLKINPL